MKKFSYLILFIFGLCVCINCNASTNTYVRTQDNLRVPSNVEVTSDNINNILNTPSVSSSEKIYDFAEVLSKKEEDKIFEQISEYIKNTKWDAVIVTTNDLRGFNISSYTYNFYDYNDFKGSGIIFVIYVNNGNPEIFIGNSGDKDGKIFQVYNDQMINSTLKYLYENSVSKGKYGEACENFVKIIDGFYNKNVSGNYKVDDDGQIVKSVPIFEIIVIAVALTFIIMVVLVTRFKSKRHFVTDTLGNKIDNNTMIIKNEYDNLVDTIVK